MKYYQICDCCGAQLTAYAHKLNQPLVTALSKLVAYYETKKEICNISDLGLSHNQINNFQKLRYFGLVKLIQKGGYVPTELGIKFIYGEELAPDTAASLGNKVLGMDHEAWNTTKVRPNWVHVTEIDSLSYKRREEYQAEKSNQSSFL